MCRNSRITLCVVCALVFLPMASFGVANIGKTTVYDSYTDWVTSGPEWGTNNYYYYLYANPAGPTSSTATMTFQITQAGLYDVYSYNYVRLDYNPDSRFDLTFKPGGQYYINQNYFRLNSIDASQAAAGIMKFSFDKQRSAVDGTLSNMLISDSLYFGRFQFDAGAYTMTVVPGESLTEGWVDTGKVGVAGPQDANTDLIYEDIDCVIPCWWMAYDADNKYYWGNHPVSWTGYLDLTKLFAFPSSDRAGFDSGMANVKFTEVYGTDPGNPDQPTDLPITVHFKPGSTPVLPSVGGMITGIVTDRQSDGIIVLQVNTRTAGTVSLGQYQMDKTETYCAKIDIFPMVWPPPGQATGCYIRKFQFALEGLNPSGVNDWSVY